MYLQTVKNPAVKRAVKINVQGKAHTLNITYRSLNRAEARELQKLLLDAVSQYYDDHGNAITPHEAIAEYLPMQGATDVVYQPVLHDWVQEQTTDSIFQAQDDMLRDLFCGANQLFEDWDLAESKDAKDPLPFNDDVYAQVFSSTEFFWPVWNDVLDMLNDRVLGADRAKNSKPSGTRLRPGRMVA